MRTVLFGWVSRRLWVGALAAAPLVGQARLEVHELRTEYLTEPLGIDALRPRFSWQLTASARNTLQTAYQLQVGRSAAQVGQGKALLWDSGRITSDASVFVDYGGPAVESRTRYFWRVRAWDSHGGESAWSPVATWETGLLHMADWSAQWIGETPKPDDSLP